MPVASASPTSNMRTNSGLLPKKTVAKNRSSLTPILSRITPTNQRKA
jgi:hypothetical protein